jgi:uncharacterized protein (TIGR03067 family)
MLRFILAAMAVGAWLGQSICFADDSAAVEAELARFRGTWQLISAETDGKKTPDEVAAKIRVVIAGTTHSVYMGDKILAHDVSWTPDPTTSPSSSTDTIREGPDKGKQIRGIYRLEGDVLTSCVGPVGGPRPVEFTAKAGSGQTLRVFRRATEDDPKAEAIRAELKRFEGTWKFESMVFDGKPVPEDGLKDSRMTIEGDRFTTKGNESAKGTFTVDPTVRPKTIDIAIKTKDGGSVKILGLYTLEGDTYTICSGYPGKPRPTEFAAGSGRGLQVMKREKP